MGLSIENSPIDFTSMVSNGANTFLGTLLGFGSQNRQYKLNSKLQRQAADLQYQTWANMTENTRNWNEYDEKMSKMAEAGLNPLYSEGSAPQAAVSAASPSSSVDAFNAPPFNLGDSVTNALRTRELRLKEREIEAIEKEKTANAKKANAEADQIIQVTPYTIKSAAQQVVNGHLTGEQIKTQTAMLKKEVEIKGKEADAAVSNAISRAIEVAIAQSANEWQEDVARQNANSNTSQANTQYYNFKLAKSRLLSELNEASRVAMNEYHKTMSSLKKDASQLLNEQRERMSFQFGKYKFQFPIEVIYSLAGQKKALEEFIEMPNVENDLRMQTIENLDELLDIMTNVENVGLPEKATKPKFKIENGFNPQP